MSAEVIPIRPDTPRTLRHEEHHVMSRALESYAYRARDEGRKLDADGAQDEAHAFYAMADRAQDALGILPSLRVTR